jgi:hypothetical protein
VAVERIQRARARSSSASAVGLGIPHPKLNLQHLDVLCGSV